ncbi:MAG: hypothetical protein NTV22_00350 [bacterium]|nr:hypothetical protein [bacterium]
MLLFGYDAVGRKVKRASTCAPNPPGTVYYIYDGLDPICTVDMLPNLPSIVTWYLRGLGVAPGIGNIVAQQRYTINFNGTASTPVTHYYHPNHRGDTAYLTDASGVKAASYVYDAFGRMLTDNCSPITDYRFSSKEWDPDAQLYYFGFRWYDSDTGTQQQYGTNIGEGFKAVEGSIPTPDTAARAKHVNDAQEGNKRIRVQDFCASGKNAWWLLFPCAHFAAEIWKAATGESLSDRTLGILTPGKLAESIRRANVADANSSLHYSGNNTFTYAAN